MRLVNSATPFLGCSGKMCSSLRTHRFIDAHEIMLNQFLIDLSKGHHHLWAPPGAVVSLWGRSPSHSSCGGARCVWDSSRSAPSKGLRKVSVLIQICWLDLGENRMKHPSTAHLPIMGRSCGRGQCPHRQRSN